MAAILSRSQCVHEITAHVDSEVISKGMMGKIDRYQATTKDNEPKHCA